MLGRFLVLSLLSTILLPASALAANPSSGNFGIGIGGGTATTGLSMKYYMSNTTALQGVIGFWGLGHYHSDVLGLSGDLLFEMPAFAKSEVLNLGWNLGPGLWLGAWSNDFGSDGMFMGASGVIGLEFLFQPLPFDIVLEYRPALMIVPDLELDLVSVDGHVRFYF